MYIWNSKSNPGGFLGGFAFHAFEQRSFSWSRHCAFFCGKTRGMPDEHVSCVGFKTNLAAALRLWRLSTMPIFSETIHCQTSFWLFRMNVFIQKSACHHTVSIGRTVFRPLQPPPVRTRWMRQITMPNNWHGTLILSRTRNYMMPLMPIRGWQVWWRLWTFGEKWVQEIEMLNQFLAQSRWFISCHIHITTRYGTFTYIIILPSSFFKWKQKYPTLKIPWNWPYVLWLWFTAALVTVTSMSLK